jgi:hypothetical protein
MRSGGRSVRLVRLPGEPRGCGPAVGRSGRSACLGEPQGGGPAVGRSGWSGCLGNHKDAVRRSVGPVGPAAIGNDAVQYKLLGTTISLTGEGSSVGRARAIP